jgi:hypothetical protein
MLRTWKMLKWASALAVAVTVTPASFSQEKEDKVLEAINKLKEDIKADFKAISTDIGKLKQEITTLQTDGLGQRLDLEKTNTKLEGLESKLAKMRADLDALKGQKISLYPDKTLEELKTRIEDLERNLSVSKSSPVAGRVLLINQYSERLLFVVNGKTHVVMPNTQVALEGQTPGALTYEVWSPTFGRTAASITTLEPNRTFTLLARQP